MKHIFVFAIASALSLSGCATTGKLSYDSDPTQDFSQYSTFTWAGSTPMAVFGNRLVPPSVEVEIAQAIKSELTQKGYRFTDKADEANFAVSFSVGTRNDVSVVEVPDPYWQNRMNWGWGSGYWPRLGTFVPTRTQVRDYTEGTLSIDFFDVSRKSPVWHGAGTRNLTRKELSGEENTASEAVTVILEGFPPN